MRLLRNTIRSLLQVSDTPRRTALAFSVGVFLGFSPFLGLHTILGLVLAFAFRLNRVAVLIGVFVNNPWSIIPFYGFATWVGMQLLGVPDGLSLPQMGFFDLFTQEVWAWLASQWRLLIPAFVGSLVLCTLLGMAAYFLALRILQRNRQPLRE